MSKPNACWFTAGFVILAFLSPTLADAVEERPTDSEGEIRFVVFTPVDDKDEGQSIYCSMSIDGWPEGGRQIRRLAPGIYSQAMKLRGPATIEYKFLREQDWKTVEKGRTGQEVRNRRLTLDAKGESLRVVHKIGSWADQSDQKRGQVVFQSSPVAPGDTLTGDIRTHRQIHFAKLDNRRDVLVWLPPSYADELERRYPVLYMLDGQNVFNEATSFKGQEWGADETATTLIEQGMIEPLIIVAVNHTSSREAEQIPLFNEPEKTVAKEYLDFLIREIKPTIDQNYRTLPEPENNVLLGASYGGMFTLYAACHAEDHFGGYAVISPSLQVEDGKIVEHVKETLSEPNSRLWIELGTGSKLQRFLSSYSGYVATAHRLRDALKAAGWEEKKDLHYAEIDGVFHDEQAWATRMEALLEFFFPAKREAP